MTSPEINMNIPKTPENQEQKKYRIAWKNKITGVTGHGKEYISKKDADAWLERKKIENPDSDHWLEPKKEEE